MNQTELFIGVDVSKNHLDVAFGHLEDAPVERFQKSQWPSSWHASSSSLIVLESTGGYERLLMEACHKARLPVAQVQPQRVRAFAKAEGLHGPAGRTAVGALWGAHAPGGG